MNAVQEKKDEGDLYVIILLDIKGRVGVVRPEYRLQG